MHEYRIAQDIIETVIAEAKKHKAKRVTAIELLVGDFNNIVADALLFNLEALARGTIAEGTKVEIRREAVSVKCADCEKEGPPTSALVLSCSHCGGGKVEICAGKALNVVSIDVE